MLQFGDRLGVVHLQARINFLAGLGWAVNRCIARRLCPIRPGVVRRMVCLTTLFTLASSWRATSRSASVSRLRMWFAESLYSLQRNTVAYSIAKRTSSASSHASPNAQPTMMASISRESAFFCLSILLFVRVCITYCKYYYLLLFICCISCGGVCMFFFCVAGCLCTFVFC